MKKLLSFILIILFGLSAPMALGQNMENRLPDTPLDMNRLKQTLSYARGNGKSDGKWPRIISYEHNTYDFRKNIFNRQERTFRIERKPVRIIAHAVGVAEILWAICPREYLIAFNEFSADPDFCFIADQVIKKGPVFKSRQTELVIGYRPDLLFIVFYSGADFKEKLNQANIPHLDLGYFGSIESIKQQVMLLGRLIGQEGNAAALFRKMDDNIQRINEKLPDLEMSVRALYYDEGGYIPGKTSNFNSICEMVKVINVGAEQGIKSWSQVDNETLLSWDPDIIIVPGKSGLKQQLIADDVLSHCSAVKNKKIFEIPGVYLRVDSQFMILSANLLAGIVYETAF